MPEKIRVLLLRLMFAVVIVFGACSQERVEQQQDNALLPKSGLVDSIKRNKLTNFQSKTIGVAFDTYKYLSRRKWTSEELGGGYFSVRFVGQFEKQNLDKKAHLSGITSRELEVRFVINPDGSFYLFAISVLDIKSDNSAGSTQLQDASAILAKIYANKKITF